MEKLNEQENVNCFCVFLWLVDQQQRQPCTAETNNKGKVPQVTSVNHFRSPDTTAEFFTIFHQIFSTLRISTNERFDVCGNSCVASETTLPR